MKQDTANSAAGSGATYPQPQRTSPRVEPRFAPASSSNGNHDSSSSSSNGDNKKVAESDFLTRESEQAKKAMSVAFIQATRDLGRSVDPRAWTAEHPWVSLSIAAVGGFFAATRFVPSKDEQLLKKLEQIREAVMPEITRKTTTEREREVAAEHLDGDGKPKKKEGRGFFNVIGTELVKYLAPALSSALSAAIAGKSVADSADQAQGGEQINAGAEDPASSI